MEYLDRDQTAFKGAGERLRQAERAVIEEGLGAATKYRVELDAARLRTAIGDEAFSALVRDDAAAGRDRWLYDVFDDALDDRRRALLLGVLVPEPGGPYEAARDYIRSIRLLDDAERTVLRGGDHLTFLLLDLPPERRASLAARLQELGLGPEVLERVDVDPATLDP